MVIKTNRISVRYLKQMKKIKPDNEINGIIMIRTRLTGVFFSYI